MRSVDLSPHELQQRQELLAAIEAQTEACIHAREAERDLKAAANHLADARATHLRAMAAVHDTGRTLAAVQERIVAERA